MFDDHYLSLYEKIVSIMRFRVQIKLLNFLEREKLLMHLIMAYSETMHDFNCSMARKRQKSTLL